ncbi:MAG: tryptophan--tRNA ligase [Deltaproteobacteria bacterium]|jgi:tryptophanyl-tRNA synthetase|nr:tryptophan--tRNA ligase [Deltaproteobacteria bacterium]
MMKLIDCPHDPSKRVVSGMRPTGPLHIGHYFGAIKNWAELQYKMESYFFVADWHALTTDYADTSRLAEYTEEMVTDWIAAGLDPEKATIYLQSHMKELADLHLLLSMITPLGWLERCPTYKEQLQNITGKDLTNYGFLGYPVLMTTDIVITRARWVPVGQDQVPHLEMSREIARRFNSFYGDVLPEPEALLTPMAKCPGLDGRKMSKSYGNGIFLKDSMEELTPKVRSMLTDKARLRKTDPGNPDVCNLYPYHEILTDEATQAEIRSGCLSASLGCVECKQIMLKGLAAFLAPIQERRAAIVAKPGYVREVLTAGSAKAAVEIHKTMDVVRQQMHLDYLK